MKSSSQIEGNKRRDEFEQRIAEHDVALTKYCRFLTGSITAGEDLRQEMWMKAWASYREKGGIQNRSYLRRIAYHAWIDGMRKSTDEIATTQDLAEEFSLEAGMMNVDRSDPLRLWSAAELLVRWLTPDQRTVYLLMEYLRFTAAETAEFLRTTEGGVKASLHRARKKLEEYRDSSANFNKVAKKSNIVDEQVVFAYMQAIQLQDVRALMVLWNGGSGEEASLAVRCAVPVPQPKRQSDRLSHSSTLQQMVEYQAAA